MWPAGDPDAFLQKKSVFDREQCTNFIERRFWTSDGCAGCGLITRLPAGLD
jgi:hypothetical protein